MSTSTDETIAATRSPAAAAPAPGAPAGPVPARARVRAQGRPGARLRRVLLALWVVAAAAAALPGLSYYRMDAEARAYSELHELYAPTGAIGHSLGYVGTLLIVTGVAMYSLRKRATLLQGLGLLPTWLQVHIFMCTMGAYLVVLHTSLRLGGLAAVAFYAMLLAVASGAVGRYVFVRVPRLRDGRERSLADARARVAELATALTDSPTLAARIERAVGAPFPAPASTLRALVAAPLSDVRRHGALRRARGALRDQDRSARAALLALLDERLRLEQQIAFLGPAHRVLRYWHVLHIPIALVMFTALALHVVVAILFGYGWPF